MLRAAKGNMWVKNFSNGFANRLTHHIQSAVASNDISNYTLLGSINSSSLDVSQAVNVTNPTTGAFYMICGVTPCGSEDQCQ
jgi:hypothetical protein